MQDKTLDIMQNKEFNEFVRSEDTVRISKGDRIIFASREERLVPLMKYAMSHVPYEKDVVVFDRVVGNAVALLLKKIMCRKVFSPLGSDKAINTLDSSGIEYQFSKTVPYIKNNKGQDMCPMEKLSAGKSSEEFFQILRDRMKCLN